MDKIYKQNINEFMAENVKVNSMIIMDKDGFLIEQ
jgi:hypothetical protein